MTLTANTLSKNLNLTSNRHSQIFHSWDQVPEFLSTRDSPPKSRNPSVPVPDEKIVSPGFGPEFFDASKSWVPDFSNFSPGLSLRSR